MGLGWVGGRQSVELGRAGCGRRTTARGQRADRGLAQPTTVEATTGLGTWTLAIDPETGKTVVDVPAVWAAERYTWRYSGWTLPRMQVLAGGDLDNDNVVCQRGEACGAYPLLSGMSPQGLSIDATPAASTGARRAAVR